MTADPSTPESNDHRTPREAGDGASDDRSEPRARRRSTVLAWVWVVLWACVIWALGGDDYSLVETSNTLSSWFGSLFDDIDYRTRYKILIAIRKSAHFVEYAILALLTFRAALHSAGRNQLATAAWVALFLVAALATADEARQAFSTARTGSPYDVLIDLTGGFLTILGLVTITRRMKTPGPIDSSA